MQRPLRTHFRCQTASRGSRCGGEMMSRFTFAWFLQLVFVCSREQKDLSQLAIGEVGLGKEASLHILALFSHLDLNMTIPTTRTDSPSSCCPLSICHKPNNNVLSPQACNNTCWRDRQLANGFIKQGPRVLFFPENHPKVLVNTSRANPT